MNIKAYRFLAICMSLLALSSPITAKAEIYLAMTGDAATKGGMTPIIPVPASKNIIMQDVLTACMKAPYQASDILIYSPSTSSCMLLDRYLLVTHDNTNDVYLVDTTLKGSLASILAAMFDNNTLALALFDAHISCVSEVGTTQCPLSATSHIPEGQDGSGGGTPGGGGGTDTDPDGDGYTVAEGDCNNNDASIYPAAIEIPYDGIDQDCNGSDLVDVDHDGFNAVVAGGADCNDNDPGINPAATDLPNNGIDEDCSGADTIVLINDLTARAKDGKVSLVWSPIANATGYNVYRATTQGGPYNLIAAGIVSDYATYLDSGLVNGVTYYYVVTNILTGIESLFSNEASATPNARVR